MALKNEWMWTVSFLIINLKLGYHNFHSTEVKYFIIMIVLPTGICESETRRRFNALLELAGTCQVKNAYKKQPNSPTATTTMSNTKAILNAQTCLWHQYLLDMKN